MPMYEYRCEDCGAKFERLSWKTGAEGANATQCGCGSSRVERIWFSRVAVGGRSESDAGGDLGDSFEGGDCGAEGGCCGGGACQVN
jgi:putative FmdB family regulatory protein